MGGGGANTTSTTQKADPWSEAQPFLKTGYNMAQDALLKTNTTPFTGRFTPEANQYQKALPGQIAAEADATQGIGNQAISLGNKTMAGNFLSGNEYLKPAMEATVNPIIRNMREVTLPAIGSAAQTAGAYGGSRQGFLEAATLRDTQQTVADTTAKMLENNYQNERKLQTLAPSITQMGQQMNLLPLQLREQAGTTQGALDAMPLQEAQLQWQERLNAPWRGVNPYTAVMSGIGTPGGTTTGTTVSDSGSRAGGMMTGALGGAGLGALAGAAGLGPVGWLALGGALLGGAAGGIR